MAGTLKGSLGLKSSPLAPTSAKLTSQYLVLDHMNNHYKKIAKARPAIDNRPPKSMLCSQKVRERKQREQVLKYGRPLSSMSMRSLSSQANYYTLDDDLWGEPEDEEDKLVYNIMKTTLQQDPGESAHATFGSRSHELEHRAGGESFGKTVRHGQTALLRENMNKLQRPCSARSSRSVMSNALRISLSQTKKAGTYDGDLLEKRAHVFTEPEKAFTPRTLKSNRQSRLKEYKYYTPPLKKKHDREMEKKQVDGGTGDSGALPQPKPRKKGDSQKGEMMETTLMFESLQSRDFNYLNKKRQEGVPTLNISVDKDHREWLKEQADKAHVRMKSEKISSSKDAASESDTREDRKTFLDDEHDLAVGKSTKLFDKKPWKSQRLSKVEEEQLYVKFAQDITKDVLNSGICSDRILQQVFDRHLEKNKHVLKMTRMRTILSKLRLDLGIRRDSGGLDDDLGSEMTAVSSLEPHNTLNLNSRRESLKNGTLEPSETSSTSYKFDETAEILSTVRSQRNETELDGQRNEDELDGLSTAQALEQYQMDITRQDNESRSEADVSEKAASGKMVNGHGKSPGELSQADSEGFSLTPRQSRRKTPSQSVHATPSTSVPGTPSASVHGTPTPSVHEMPSSSGQGTYSSSIQATPSVSLHTMSSHSLQSVPATPTHGPRPRPRDRRHAAMGKQNSVTDDECSSVKGSEVSISVSDHRIDTELNNTPTQVGSGTSVIKPRARARRHTSREESISAAEEELSHHVKASETRNDHLETKTTDKRDVTQQDDSSSELADKLQTGLSIQNSGSQQNQDIVSHTTEKDVQEGNKPAAVKEENDDDYEDDYEDDYDADEDDAHGDSTHRTSDDDF